MRSYGQYCALARGLDAVGDRWSLLVVRELLAGPRRYGELQAGLPGIATNLLVERLRHLQGHGVVDRTADGRYRLTSWGEGLRDVVYALGRWSAPVTMVRPVGGDAYRSDWLAHPVAVIFGGPDPARGELVVEVRTGDAPMTVRCHGGVVSVRAGAPERPDVVVAGQPDLVLGVLAGVVPPAVGVERGVALQGAVDRLQELRPTLFGPPDAHATG